jgi:hypothetical protein
MFAVGVVLLVLERTNSPSLAGLTVAAATLPGMLSGPVIERGSTAPAGGHSSTSRSAASGRGAARHPRRAGRTPDVVVPLLAFITGLTLPVTMTGFTSMIPLIVERRSCRRRMPSRRRA